MNNSANKLTTFEEKNGASLDPIDFAQSSAEGSKPRADFKNVVETGILDPTVLAKHLSRISLYDSIGGAIKAVQVRRVLKFHAGKRCTLEIALRTDGGWQFLIAKVYRKDRSDVFQTMMGIVQAGFGPRDEFSISQPIGYASSLRCLLQEKVQGTPADDIFKNGDNTARMAAAERCAEWLASFHAHAPKAGPISHPKDFVDSKPVERWAGKIARLEGRLGAEAAHLLQRLKDKSVLLKDVELKAGHGSYNAAHVYLSKDRTVTIDWDWHDMADPARDVARFLFALRRSALDAHGSIRALDVAAEVFLATYQAVGPPIVMENLLFFGATTCLNLAIRHIFDDGPSWQEKQTKAEAMLDEGFRVLGGESI